MRTIHLHGDLARFGGPFCWDVASPAEAVRGLCRQVPGFRHRLSDGSFHVISGDLEDGFEHEAETLTLLADEGAMHFIPAVQGAGGGNGGFTKILAGAALIGLSFLPIGPALTTALGSKALAVGALSAAGGLGASLVLGGVAQLLSPTPSIDSNESPDKRPSFLFNSGINRIEAGNPVPLAFGLFRVGSVVGSAGIAVEELPFATNDGGSDKFLTGTP